jgi:hypothetical protein
LGREDFLDLKALHPLHLKLDIVSREQVGEEGLLVKDFNKRADRVVGIISVALFANHSELAFIKTF